MSENTTTIDDNSPAEEPFDKAGASERVAAARQKFSEAVEGVTQKAKGAGSRAKETYGVASDNIRQGYDRVSKDFGHLTEDVNEYVRHNPGKAIAIAAGVGFFVGILLRGRRD
jgi:ElaB/YqjD/DUF883 family membrane-anchored ribosome-binding protein